MAENIIERGDAEIADILEPFSRPDQLLPALHALQDRLGHVPKTAIPALAKSMGLSRAEVQGVVGFYHHFRTTRPGRHTLRICRAEACQAMGARALERAARRLLGIDWHQTSADGAVSLEPVYCLGNCALSPALMVDDELVGRVDPARLGELLAGRGIAAGAARGGSS